MLISSIKIFLHRFALLRSSILRISLVVLILHGVKANSIKYNHGPLVSALSGRQHDFGAPTLTGAPSPRGSNLIGVNSAVSPAAIAIGNVVQGPAGGGSNASPTLEDRTGRGGEVVLAKSFSLGAEEPSCEELRAMWIFSKRQSRAAEITNEIPTYRDPFTYNVWEPYYSTTRSVGAIRMLPRYSERSRSPVFGRVISREPLIPQRMSINHRQRYYNGDGSSTSSRIYGAETKASSPVGATVPAIYNSGSTRRPSQYRYIGANNPTTGINEIVAGNPNSVAVQGSFQKLKELIWTERAKELTQQRRAEELAARAAVLKEIANGQNIQPLYKNPLKNESPLMDENRSPDRDVYHNLNDGRISITTSQSHIFDTSFKKSNQNNSGNNNSKKNKNRSTYNNKGNNKNNNKNYSDYREEKDLSIYNVGAKIPLGNIRTATLGEYSARSFTGNRNSHHYNNYNSKNSDLTKPHAGMLLGNYFNDDLIHEYELNHEKEEGIDMSRIYPMRPSHFRERNRALFNQGISTDTFQRKARNPDGDKHHYEHIQSFQNFDLDTKKPLLMEKFINGPTQHVTITPYITDATKDINRNSLEGLTERTASVSDIEGADDRIFFEDPVGSNYKSDWIELNTATSNAFLNHFNPISGIQSAKIPAFGTDYWNQGELYNSFF